MPWIDDASGAKDKERYPDVLGPVESKPGMFFGTIEVIFEKIKAFALALLVACFTLYLMQHFSETLAEFAADMTEGVSIGNMAIKPQTLYKAGMAAMSAAGGAKGGGDKAAAGGAKGGGDKAAAGAGGGGDNFSTASFKGRKGGGADNFSTASSKGAKDVSSTKGGNKEGGDA